MSTKDKDLARLFDVFRVCPVTNVTSDDDGNGYTPDTEKAQQTQRLSDFVTSVTTVTTIKSEEPQRNVRATDDETLGRDESAKIREGLPKTLVTPVTLVTEVESVVVTTQFSASACNQCLGDRVVTLVTSKPVCPFCDHSALDPSAAGGYVCGACGFYVFRAQLGRKLSKTTLADRE